MFLMCPGRRPGRRYRRGSERRDWLRADPNRKARLLRRISAHQRKDNVHNRRFICSRLLIGLDDLHGRRSAGSCVYRGRVSKSCAGKPPFEIPNPVPRPLHLPPRTLRRRWPPPPHSRKRKVTQSCTGRSEVSAARNPGSASPGIRRFFAPLTAPPRSAASAAARNSPYSSARRVTRGEHTLAT